MAMQMNECFYSGNEPHWQKNVDHQRLYGYSTDFDYPTSGRTLPTYEFQVPMCCAKCEEKVREELSEMDGVCDIFADQRTHRVTVTGFFDPFQALKKMKRIKKKSQFWDGPRKSSLRDNQISLGHAKPHSRHHETVYRTFPSQVSYNREPTRSSSSLNYGSYDDEISYSSRLRPHRYMFYGSYDDEVAYSDLRPSSSYMPGYRHGGSSSSWFGSMPRSQRFRFETVPPFVQEYDTEYPMEEYPFYSLY